MTAPRRLIEWALWHGHAPLAHDAIEALDAGDEHIYDREPDVADLEPSLGGCLGSSDDRELDEADDEPSLAHWNAWADTGDRELDPTELPISGGVDD